jgi:UDP-2,3-diacylglucosamine hydrolase
MKISAISDVHVKTPHDEADKLLCAFLDHPQVRSSDYICLLGDIFDLMNGNHSAYLKDFSHLFEKMNELMRDGKKVLFFEGNHDIHLEKLFLKKWKQGEFIPFQYPLIETIEGKTYYFSHGDEHEVDNLKYQNYKNFLLTPFVKFASNNLMPYFLLNFIGKKASESSRKKGYRQFDENVVKERFRSGVKQTTEGKYNFVLGGHSHVKDEFQINPKSVYLNNGFALRTKTFILIENHHPRFEPLV